MEYKRLLPISLILVGAGVVLVYVGLHILEQYEQLSFVLIVSGGALLFASIFCLQFYGKMESWETRVQQDNTLAVSSRKVLFRARVRRTFSAHVSADA